VSWTVCWHRFQRAPNQFVSVPSCEARKRADPNIAVASDQQAINVFIRELLICRWVPRESANTVEAKKAEFRPEPEIPVGRLGYRINVTDCEPVPYGPCSVGVLGDVERGIQPEAATAA
jgi:hypothetical protein